MGERVGDEMVTIEAKVEHSTEKAWLIIDNMSGKQAWLPKSVGKIIEDVDRDGNTLFEAKEWWARKNGMI
jgi:hypothetical protein